MPSTSPTLGFLPAAFSNTALLMIARRSGMEQRLDLGHELRAALGLDHVNVRGVAREVGGEVVAPARLRVEPVLPAVVEDRAEPLTIEPRHVHARVDDDAGDALLVLVAQDAPLVGAL